MTAPTEPSAPSAPSASDGGASGRSYRAALALLLLGSVLTLVSAGRTWVTAVAGGGGLPTITVTLSGSDLQPTVTAIALLGLAAVAGLVATHRRGRVVIGLLMAAAGLVVAALAIDVATTWNSLLGVGATIRSLVAEHVGTESAATTTLSPWWVGATVGGLLVAVAGVLAVLRSRDWPQMGRRYERRDDDASRPAESAWDQLDHGVDPTLDASLDTLPDTKPGTAPGTAPDTARDAEPHPAPSGDVAPGAQPAASGPTDASASGPVRGSGGLGDPMLGSEPSA